jgi:hypothetical protein
MNNVPNTQNLFTVDVTIANGGSAAPPELTEGYALVGIEMPAAWTAAALGFEVSIDGATFYTAYDNAGNLLQATVAASRHIVFPLDSAIYGPFLKVKSVGAGTDVAANQGAARTLRLVFRRLFS